MKHTIKLEVIELEEGNYHLFVNLTIQGFACRLLLDTGASKTVFDKKKVKVFSGSKKAKIHHSKSVGLGTKEMETGIIKLKKLVMGSLVIKKLEVAVLPLGHINEAYSHVKVKEIDGVLGSDFLMQYNAVINYKKKRLILES